MNWKFAIGEVLLIVVGVMIAIMASDWQNQRNVRESESVLLEEMRSSLSEDRKTIEGSLQRFRLHESTVTELLAHLRAKLPYDSSLDRQFGFAYSLERPEYNLAAYESLKSQGLDVISNSTLRSHITQVYEETYGRLSWSVELETDVVLNLLRPYYLSHFRDLSFGINATPLDYASISADILFHNLLDYRRQTIRQAHIVAQEQSIVEIDQLIEEISTELDR